MKLIEITPDLLTGVEEMDNQHIKMAEYINHVWSLALEGKIEDAISFYKEILLPYVKHHLSSEEEFMKSIGYPKYEEHKRRHDAVVGLFERLGNDLKDKDSIREAVYTLSAWLYGHVGKVDKDYGEFYKKVCLKNT